MVKKIREAEKRLKADKRNFPDGTWSPSEYLHMYNQVLEEFRREGKLGK